MKKTTFEKKFGKAVNAFFKDEYSSAAGVPATSDSQAISGQGVSALEQKADKYYSLFRKIFAFVPGVLFLHLAAVCSVEFGMNLWAVFWYAAGFFLVWAGIGNLAKSKHALLPLSVTVVALVFALPYAFLPESMGNHYTYFYICIMPLLFVAPILTKNYLDGKEELFENI